MTNTNFKFLHPNLSEIQCTKCKYQAILEWDGKQIRMPGACSCKKYPKQTPKPAGIIFRKYDVSKHEIVTDGHYIKCPYFEKE